MSRMWSNAPGRLEPFHRIARQLAAIGITARTVSLDAAEYFRLLDPANIGELEALASTLPAFGPVLAMAREDAEAMRKWHAEAALKRRALARALGGADIPFLHVIDGEDAP